MKTKPQVSVIIINYNTFSLTSGCIRSVLQFTKGVSFEIILVDNGSSECPPERFRQEFPEIKLVLSKENTGFSKGNNLGIAQSEGEIILLLNSDTELQSDAVSACYHELKKQNGAGIISCRLHFPDGKIQKQCQRFPSVLREFLQTSRLIRLLPSSFKARYFLGNWFDHQRSCSPDWVWGAFFMFPKEILTLFPEQKLPETYFMYGEDIEWCWLVRRSGKSVFYYAGTAVVHHMGQSSAERKVREMFLNEKDFIIRHLGERKWKHWRFWRLLNYKISVKKNPEFAQYRDILQGL